MSKVLCTNIQEKLGPLPVAIPGFINFKATFSSTDHGYLKKNSYTIRTNKIAVG